jgi:hypothetical protein
VRPMPGWVEVTGLTYPHSRIPGDAPKPVRPSSAGDDHLDGEQAHPPHRRAHASADRKLSQMWPGTSERQRTVPPFGVDFAIAGPTDGETQIV